MLGLTGRFGDGWVPTMKVSGDVYRQRLDTIMQAGHDAGRDMSGFVACQVMACALGESRDQIIDTAMKSRLGAAMSLMVPGEVWKEHGLEHPLGADHKGFIDIVPPRVTEEQLDTAARTLVPELLLSQIYAGNPSEVRDEIAEIVDAGARHLIVANIGGALTGGSPRDLLRLASVIRKLRRL
jgi:phthiodiolone/phenolphthiodiolone dimycocerosates ketoreductase